MTTAPLLITGGGGQVGEALARLCEAEGIAYRAPDRAALDLTDEAALTAAVNAEPLSAIINCAAYTAVDRAESEPGLASVINGRAPAVLAEAAARRGIPIVHLSTDYVFDGTKVVPYVESDPVGPISVYGRTKLAGEQGVRSAGGAHAIVRTAWVVSAGPRNFIDTMLRLAQERDEVRVVSDQHGCPTSASDLAAAVLTVAKDLNGRAGIWNFVNSGAATWHDLAGHCFAALKQRGMKSPRLVAIATSDYPTPAARPVNSRLETGKIHRDFAIAPRAWQAAVTAILDARLTGSRAI